MDFATRIENLSIKLQASKKNEGSIELLVDSKNRFVNVEEIA
jgi:hypothetical protein